MVETLTVPEMFAQLVAGSPRWVEAPRSGQAMTIIGARPTGGAAATLGGASRSAHARMAGNSATAGCIAVAASGCRASDKAGVALRYSPRSPAPVASTAGRRATARASGRWPCDDLWKKGLEIKPFASDESAASCARES
jgi:hypothetical protein